MDVVTQLAKMANIIKTARRRRSYLLPPKGRKTRRSVTLKTDDREKMNEALHADRTSNAQLPGNYGKKLNKKSSDGSC